LTKSLEKILTVSEEARSYTVADNKKAMQRSNVEQTEKSVLEYQWKPYFSDIWFHE